MQDNNTDERKWYLATKVLTSGLNAAEESEWATFKNDLQFQADFERVKQHWHQLETLPYQQIDAGKDWRRVLEQIEHHKHTAKKQRHFAPWLKYAATIVMGMSVAFFAGWYINTIFGSEETSIRTTIEAPPGSKTLITLPDNSKVWLNAYSKISYDKNFGQKNRYLSLEGEAFFDVVKNTVPFKVHTPVYDIAVLGTAFNVKAYADDNKATTTLVRGSLKVEYALPSGKTEAVLLKPNEKLIASRTTPASGITTPSSYAFAIERGIDAEIETAWKDGWLTVRGESLNELAKKLERLYDVKVHFTDQSLQNYRYTGRLRQLSLEQVLKALSLTSPVEFTITEKTVTLRENEKTKSKYQSLQTP